GQRGFVLQGESTNDMSGWAISKAGDVDGDGVDDLIIGGPYANYASGGSYIVFGNIPPQFLVNYLTVYQGSPLLLSSQNFNATDNRPVFFNITSVNHGRFEYVNNPGQAITYFSQAQVWSGKVQFMPDGGNVALSYSVQIPDRDFACKSN